MGKKPIKASRGRPPKADDDKMILRAYRFPAPLLEAIKEEQGLTAAFGRQEEAALVRDLIGEALVARRAARTKKK